MSAEQIAQFIGLGGVVLLAALAIGVRAWKARSKPSAPIVEEKKPEPTAANGSCMFCSLPAERPPSRMQASAFDGWRVRFGMAPRYAIAIEAFADATLCRGHGRLWDTLLQAKATQCVRARQEQAHVASAADIAAYESEGLQSDMVAKLTETQRAALEGRAKGPPS